MNDQCELCGEYFADEGFCRWVGEPFSRRGAKELCIYCLSVLKPKTIQNGQSGLGVALVGTYDDDILALSEMVSDGFIKKRAANSLKIVAKHLDLSSSILKKRLAT